MDSDLSVIRKKYTDILSNFIKKNDNIYIECDLLNFKEKSLLIDKSFFCKFYLEIFKELIGNNGTLVTPSFSYSWGSDLKRKIFNIMHTPSKCGIFSNYIINETDILRTHDPMFSLLVSGPYDFDFNYKNSFGNDSLYKQMHDANFKILHFGLPYFDPTFIHLVEQNYNDNVETLDYRKNYSFDGFYVDSFNNEYYDHWWSFMRNNSFKYKYLYSKIENIFDPKILSKISINNAKIYIINSKNFCEIYYDKLLEDKNFFIKYE